MYASFIMAKYIDMKYVRMHTGAPQAKLCDFHQICHSDLIAKMPKQCESNGIIIDHILRAF